LKARDGLYLAVGAAVMLVPAALALAVFPTAMIDTRELFAWGRHFPLVTHKHPPLMALIGGLVETVLPPNAFSAILVGQILNAVGVLYLYLTLLMVVARDRARLFAFLFATSLYFQLAPLSYALNADILQVPIWLAIVYHLIRAARSNSLSHWLALAAWVAAAFLTKYTAGLLILAGVAATLAVPEFRGIWRNPRLYLAAVCAVLLVTPHLLALRTNSAALTYAEQFTLADRGVSGRLAGIVQFIGGTLLFLAPGWIVIAAGFLNGNCTLAGRDDDPDRRATVHFVQVLAVATVAILLVMTLTLGTLLNHRYGAPLFGLFVLALAPLVAVNPATWSRAEPGIIAIAGVVAGVVFLASVVVYGFFTSHNYMQEPTGEAAAIMRAEWNRHFTCGPGYYLGDRPSAHGLALAGDRHPVGMPLEDIPLAHWYKPALLQREGAIVAFRTPIPADIVRQSFPDAEIAEQPSFTLPLLRTFSGATITYHYFFIPPQSCTIAAQ